MTRISSVHKTNANLRLEIVTDTLDGLRAAVDGGADRIELVTGLALGGLTPAIGLMEDAAPCPVPVRAMIRPRAGDFTYSGAEVTMMQNDIDMASQVGISGVILGANLSTGELNPDILACLSEHAQMRGLDVAVHRSFDLAPDALAAIDLCVSLRIKTVLTSGGPRFAEDGTDGLRRYVDHAGGRIEIMAGSGLNANNARRIVEASGVNWVHASCSRTYTVDGRQPPNDRVVALGGVTAIRTETNGSAVHQLRNLLDSLAPAACQEAGAS